MAVSIIITPNILEYVWEMWNFKTPVYLYQNFLDCLNIMYIITPITSFDFKNFNFLILPKIDGIDNIEKTIIFAYKIEKDRTSVIYLQTFLLNKLKNRGEDIIKSFLSILEIITRTNWLEKFLIGNTKIIIYVDITKMMIDILDIRHIIQWKKLLSILLLSQFLSKLNV